MLRKQSTRAPSIDKGELFLTMSARIHVLVAQSASVAVILRRGPSKQVCSILWDLRTNKFKLGQWLKGRIYERRSHISPDGKHMIYFAMNGKWDSETSGSWTAISKAPYLKAIVLYAKGDCWNGGGLFIDSKNYLLNELYADHRLLHDQSKLIGKRGVIKDTPYSNNECLGVYYPRLLSEGWNFNRELSSNHIQAFDKKWKKNFTLRKFAHVGSGRKAGRGVYWDSHALVNSKDEISHGTDWEWADVIKGNLAWSEGGKLYVLKSARSIHTESLLKDAKMLHDFNPMRFEETIAPY